jgi:two-component system phosphate regulon response regulator OmpR
MPRVLILDDEKLIRWSLEQILSQEGYDVDSAANTEEALKLADSMAYSLIIADLEVCGEQVKSFYSRMLARQEGARIIILTALPRDQAEQTLGDFRANLILEKPFASEAIKNAARDVLNEATDGNR